MCFCDDHGEWRFHFAYIFTAHTVPCCLKSAPKFDVDPRTIGMPTKPMSWQSQWSPFPMRNFDLEKSVKMYGFDSMAVWGFKRGFP